jgi:DNA modification methylase
MEDRKVKCFDSLAFLELTPDFYHDIIFADPPYALGSEVIIKSDGKVDYAKANDFMNKWEMPTGEFWEKWFIEAYRTLKHGGYLLMYGMDRQLLLFKYYASLAGFQEQQSIYWYYISNFPKATDLSKMIDKNAGAEREVVAKSVDRRGDGTNYDLGMNGKITSNEGITDLAKKYEGYKYSVAPLKQTCETIMVFKKPNKTGSALHDTLAMENGDDTITCSALDIDGNRVGYDMNDKNPATNPKYRFENGYKTPEKGQKSNGTSNFTSSKNDINLDGRYPSQTFIDSQVAEKLDLQSGNLSQADRLYKTGGENNSWFVNEQEKKQFGDIGGCSKILHKCDYEKIDFDLFIYEPKVNSGERNNGLDDIEDKVFNRMREDKGEPTGLNKEGRFAPTIAKNNHPTLKPIDLNCKILKLFKTPNEQRICYPFAGSGSEIIGGLKANFQNWTACEINPEYVEIANTRIKHYKENEYVQIDLFGGL